MLSLDTTPASVDGLIQLLAWDPSKGAYNFFQRVKNSWFFVGDSWDALADDTRGQGPFDGHINGSLVMKELRFPWVHWGSMEEAIEPAAFAPTDPVVNHRLFQEHVGAEILEDLVIAGINKWTESRFAKLFDGQHLDRADTFLRQLVEPRAINIVSSSQTFREIGDGSQVRLPWDIFLNREFWGLQGILRPGTISGVLRIAADAYLRAVRTINQRLQDDASGFSQPGDSFFAFACPSAAFEDLSMMRALLDKQIVSSRLIRSILAVDFCNPIQSLPRHLLARHFPASGTVGQGVGSIENQVLASMERAAAEDAQSTEAQILERMGAADEASFVVNLSDEIATYIEALKINLATEDGVLDIVKLVGSRRKFFRDLAISEFQLAFPFSTQDEEGYLMMSQQGLVVPSDFPATGSNKKRG